MKQRLLAGLMSVLMCLPSGQLLLASADSEAASMTTYATGAIYESPEEFEARTGTEIKEDSEIVGRASTTLPSSFDVTTNAATKDYFPLIGNQGEISSCVGWATTYYQFTYEVNRFKGEPTTADNIYSPTWTYNYINGGVDKGSSIGYAYSVLKNQGAMKLADLPHNNSDSTYSFSWPSDITKMTEALEYRATLDTLNVSSTTSANFNLVKEKLAAGQIATVYIDAYGWSIGRTNDGEQIVVRGSANAGGHNMTVVGYDDNIQVTVNGVTLTGAFKLANSWGTDWGNNGYIWVAYDALNSQSAFGDEWQSEFSGTRESIFDSSNRFYFIDIRDCNVCFAGKVKFFSDDPWNLKFYAALGNTAADTTTNKRWGYKNAEVLPSTERRFIVFDYFSIDGAYDLNTYLSCNWTTTIKGNPDNNTNYSFQILDNLGNPISETTELMLLTSTKQSTTIPISLAKGRVTAYDNAMITHEDSEMVLNSLIDLVEFSNLQQFLADYNSDGTVTTADVIAMNNYIAAQNGETYSLTDHIDAWGCSLADVIEDEFDMTIEEYVTENYAELSAMDVIPAELEIRGEAYAEK